jgi:hypothetical protein
MTLAERHVVVRQHLEAAVRSQRDVLAQPEMEKRRSPLV